MKIRTKRRRRKKQFVLRSLRYNAEKKPYKKRKQCRCPSESILNSFVQFAVLCSQKIYISFSTLFVCCCVVFFNKRTTKFIPLSNDQSSNSSSSPSQQQNECNLIAIKLSSSFSLLNKTRNKRVSLR